MLLFFVIVVVIVTIIKFFLFSLRRAKVFKLDAGKKLESKIMHDVIYAPMCCKIDLSDPNKRKSLKNNFTRL